VGAAYVILHMVKWWCWTFFGGGAEKKFGGVVRAWVVGTFGWMQGRAASGPTTTIPKVYFHFYFPGPAVAIEKGVGVAPFRAI